MNIPKIESLKEIEEILKNRIKDIPISQIPHYLKLTNTKEAALLIREYIKNNRFITIIGDYDVDGIVSSAILTKFFKEIGYKNFEVLIPNRLKEGYGISLKILERMNPLTELVITVDNGITGYEAFEELKRRGIKTILTDHHTPKKDENGKEIIPNADIVINPKVSFDYHMKEICGAEVAWYLLAALKNEGGFKIDLKDYLDYLSIAIIADVMPLIDMNRALVIAGLNKMRMKEKPFSKVLIERFGKIDSSTIAFQVAPRLNATGRLDKADKALSFLLTDSYEEAVALFEELNSLNESRKEIQNEAKANLNPIIYDRFVFAIGEFHPGVAGIIASKFVEEYKKPCIVFNEKDGILKGSGRSLGNVDLFKLINPLKDLYITFGGHPGACGISIEKKNFEKFAQILDTESKKMFKEEDYFIDENVIGEIDFTLINKELLRIIEKYEPYGFGNPMPIFITRNVEIEKKQIIKEKFLKMFLNQKGIITEAIIFKKPEVGNRLKLIKYSVKRKYYGEGRPSLVIKELIPF